MWIPKKEVIYLVQIFIMEGDHPNSGKNTDRKCLPISKHQSDIKGFLVAG